MNKSVAEMPVAHKVLCRSTSYTSIPIAIVCAIILFLYCIVFDATLKL